MKFAKYAAAAAALAIMPATAQAQDAAPAASAAASVEISQGDSVVGNDGNPIGTIVMVNQQAAVVDTGANQIPLPRNAFGEGESGLTLNITKAELDSSFEQQVAAAEAALAEKLVAGTQVMTADAQVLGTVDTVEGDNVVLLLENEEKLTLGRNVFAVDGNDALIVRATKAQIDQAMASGAPAADQG